MKTNITNYKGLNEFCYLNRIHTIKELERRLGFSAGKFRNGTDRFNIFEIKYILKVTGMTFEECFEEYEKEKGEKYE